MCHNCGKAGHIKKYCWASGGGAEGMGPRMGNQAAGGKGDAQKGAHFAFATLKGSGRSTWLIDSGATQHYTFDRTVFSSFREVADTLRVADGRSVAITGVGSVMFEVDAANGASHTMELKTVYLAPALAANLISLTQLDEHARLTSHTKAGKMVFKTSEGITVFSATRNGSYFQLNATVVQTKAANMIVHEANLTADVWHARMGCLGCESLKKLATTGMVHGMKVVGGFDVKCDVCAVGRSTRTPFRESPNPRARHPLDLIHMDLLVVNCLSRQGERYALVIIDNHSSCKFAFPLKKKNGASILAVMRSWLGWAERVTNPKAQGNALGRREGVPIRSVRGVGSRRCTSSASTLFRTNTNRTARLSAQTER